jgi:predicted  nucleic acid-binding Zn-ribbon protein
MSAMKDLAQMQEMAKFTIAEQAEEIRKLKMEIHRITMNVDAKRERIKRLFDQIYEMEQQP